MKSLFFGLLLLCSLVAAQNVFNFPDPADFPGNGRDAANFPQNAGGGTHFPDLGEPDAPFFEDQTNLPAFEGWSTGATGGLTGAYPGQVRNKGVDPVRGILVNANLNVGSSGKAATGRSGRGAASGNGFGIAETKFPDRLDIHTTDFISTSLSSGNSLVPALFSVFVVLAMFI
mmetsp:Transcript_63258/g.95446  ORF Transcript_63258/g.95446 Transcript_63258/m.95446 type:complete len:173 (-) Transcript_63258:67-585(-)|eukprot:CAMPEP_0117046092 /NCGR_PEP_ID=MMETSP0472-20121206/31884_1 /TAXON_ID=693140 ORGANISM="Tiarina fusus, Strain LIS" /NCGR_SAMPLE_ID=MMETSP0472 /ASSEMBLY_ACC=CAM_ASM_000603 /LENGTH=172 /DNA_ID=CAMNT_0004758339 /DNA_START=41 /DNA_END=559 /DNA_ORIENTATION=-